MSEQHPMPRAAWYVAAPSSRLGRGPVAFPVAAAIATGGALLFAGLRLRLPAAAASPLAAEVTR